MGFSANDFVLFLVLDGKENNGDFNGKYGSGIRGFNYESESIKCVKAWRDKAGWLKDIRIVCFTPTDREISDITLTTLKEYGVDCDYLYSINRIKYPCGYWNVPYAGAQFENNRTKEKYIIHIDLDMFLIREIPCEYLIPSQESFAKIAINEHRPTNQPNVNFKRIYPFEINTGFIVSKSTDNFYTLWWRHLKNISRELDINDPNYSIWEERICDVMYFDLKYQFDFFDKYQLNSDVSDFTDDEILDIYFLHGHPELEKRNEKYLKNYIKRLLHIKGNFL